jgi:DNA-binding CsgD family transcriptional regulator
MFKSVRIDGADLRALFRLFDECRLLGDDSRVWRSHFAQQLAQLIDADLVFCVETAGCRALVPKDLGVADWGWENGFDLAGWARALSEFQKDPFYSLGLQRYFAQFIDSDGVACSRRDLITNRDWDGSFDHQVIHRTVGVDHALWCFRSLPSLKDEQIGVIALRGKGRRDFEPKTRAIVAEAQALLAPAVGGSLARFTDPAPSQLSRRTRQVLRCLLEGDGDKQIAARLAISPLTVNVHTKAIYKHFGVSSRAELLARWIRRRWGGGPWDSQPPISSRK